MGIKKDACKEIMGRLFGPATASQINNMSEEECVDKCKARVSMFLGAEIAEKEFAALKD